MGPKPTPSKQQNTLFSYFSKSPVVKNDDSCKSGLQDVLSPKRSPNQKSPPSKKGKDSGLSCGKLLTLCSVDARYVVGTQKNHLNETVL